MHLHVCSVDRRTCCRHAPWPRALSAWGVRPDDSKLVRGREGSGRALGMSGKTHMQLRVRLVAVLC